MTLEEFKAQSSEIKELFKRQDVKDFDNGSLIIYSENLEKYLEEYACKDVEDLEDTLWYSYGVYVKIID